MMKIMMMIKNDDNEYDKDVDDDNLITMMLMINAIKMKI